MKCSIPGEVGALVVSVPAEPSRYTMVTESQTQGCSAGSSGEEAALGALLAEEGSVPAGSPEEELEEAPGKAHEWGWLPAQHGAGARRLYRHGTNRSPSRGPARGSSSCGFHWGTLSGCIPCREVTLKAEQEQPRHTWGSVVTASLPALSRKPDRRNFSHLAVAMHF